MHTCNFNTEFMLKFPLNRPFLFLDQSPFKFYSVVTFWFFIFSQICSYLQFSSTALSETKFPLQSMVLPVPTHVNHYMHKYCHANQPPMACSNHLIVWILPVCVFFSLRINAFRDWTSAFRTKFGLLLLSIHFSAPKLFVFYLYLSHTKRPLRSELTARSFVYSSVHSPFSHQSFINQSLHS